MAFSLMNWARALMCVFWVVKLMSCCSGTSHSVDRARIPAALGHQQKNWRNTESFLIVKSTQVVNVGSQNEVEGRPKVLKTLKNSGTENNKNLVTHFGVKKSGSQTAHAIHHRDPMIPAKQLDEFDAVNQYAGALVIHKAQDHNFKKRVRPQSSARTFGNKSEKMINQLKILEAGISDGYFEGNCCAELANVGSNKSRIINTITDMNPAQPKNNKILPLSQRASMSKPFYDKNGRLEEIKAKKPAMRGQETINFENKGSYFSRQRSVEEKPKRLRSSPRVLEARKMKNDFPPDAEEILKPSVNSVDAREVKTRLRKTRSAPSGALSESPLTERWAVIGGRVLMPCDVTPHPVDDAPLLMLISRGETPIYSVDARKGGRLDSGVHWSSPNHLASRARFQMIGGGALEVNPVQAADQSDYHCRVEFRDSPTRNSRVRLQIVVVPQSPEIMDESGKDVKGIIGPYELGDTISLSCRVKGGYPKPRVTWWHERFLLDDLSEVSEGPTTINKITLPNLSRQHLDRKLTCQADNSNLTKSLQSSVILNMSFPPASVDIIGEEGPLSEGRKYSFTCQVTGSRPPATLVWFKDAMEINQTKALEVHSAGETQSTLLVKPTRSDNGKTIACRGTNPLIPDKFKEDVRLLTVHYPPAIEIKLGSNLDSKQIKERDDVYFECIIDSNPPVTNLRWYLNDEEVLHSAAEGIILSNRSLVLQKISRHMTGDYSCSAANVEGEARSSPLHLLVQFSPVCSAQQQWVYGGGRREPVNITCAVESSPEPHTFRWSLNTSASDVVDVPRSRAFNNGRISVLAYTPHTPLDYGALLCWAENAVGLQKHACVYQVVPAAVPEQVHNCSAWHNSSASGQVVLRCWPGWDGGLQQTFSLEVHDVDKGIVASLENQRSPRFTVHGLKPGLEYLLRVTASNSQGSAEPVTMTHLTPIDIAEKRLSKSPSNIGGVGVPTALGVMGGVVGVLLLCCFMMVMLLRVRNAGARRASQISTKLSVDGRSPEEDRKIKSDKDPDVILVSADVRDAADERDLQQMENLDPSDPGSHITKTGVVSADGSPIDYIGPRLPSSEGFQPHYLPHHQLHYSSPDRDVVAHIAASVFEPTSNPTSGPYGNPPIAYSQGRRQGKVESPESLAQVENPRNSNQYQGVTGSSYSEALGSLTSPVGTLKKQKGPSTLKTKQESPFTATEAFKTVANKDESLLRVQGLKGKKSGRPTPAGSSNDGVSSPQRESIV